MQIALSRKLADAFRAKIRSGEWAAGERLPTTRALAAEYQVSLNTIQSAFRELEADDLVVRHSRRGGYVKVPGSNSTARATTVALIAPFPSLDETEWHGWSYRIARAAERELARQDFHVSLVSYDAGNPAEPGRVMGRLDHLGDDLAGVVCFPMAGLRELIDELDRRNVPWVTINRAGDHYAHNFVTADNLEGGQLLGRCFARLGLNRVLILGTPLTAGGTACDKYLGFMRGYLEGGMPTPNVDYRICNGFDKNAGYEQTRAHVERYGTPKGVFATGDLMALGAMEYCREHGLAVPGDVAIVGSTGLDAATYVHPTLSVLQQPMEQLGVEAVVMLLDMVREETRRLIGRYIASPLIIRESFVVDEPLMSALRPQPAGSGETRQVQKGFDRSRPARSRRLGTEIGT